MASIASKFTVSGRLKDLLKDIESGEVDVDVLSEKVKRATELIKLCKDRLRNTQKAVEQTLVDIEEEPRLIE